MLCACEKIHFTLHDEVYFTEFLSIPHYVGVIFVASGVHVNNEFIREPMLTESKKVMELVKKIFENEMNQLCLHAWCQIVIKVILFYHHIKVKLKSVVDELFYVAVKSLRKMIALAFHL